MMNWRVGSGRGIFNGYIPVFERKD